MGTLYKRGNVYYADFTDKRGKRNQRSLRTTDRLVAKARLRDLELATTDSGTHATEILSDALDYFTGTVCASKPSPTRSSYEQKARHLSRLLGKSKLDDLTRAHVERYIAKRIEEGAHTHSVHKELVVLRQTLQSADERGTFHGVVTKVVPKFRAGYVPRETYLTEEQFSRLLWNILAPAHPNATPKTLQKIESMRLNRILYCMIIAFASPRRGELEKLQWEHVDLSRRMMRVPKGKTKARIVPISPELYPWLQALHQTTGPVVQPWPNDKRELARACARAGVPRVTPNDLRRTFATWLKQKDVDSAVVAAMMGHSSTAMVDRVYGKLDEMSFRRAIAKLPQRAESTEPDAAAGCHAGATHSTAAPGADGTAGTGEPKRETADSGVESAESSSYGVRAEGLEPSTSGLRVRCSTIELCPRLGWETSSVFSESGATRTPDLRVRSPALYPTELRTLARAM
jgi:integrase